VIIRFGPFTVDSDTRQLLRGATECHLPPKAFDLLWSLLERRPKVVEKTELHARIWPDTFVVDGSLNVLIGQIRRALEDDPQRPRFVRTVHGVGYAFCGDAIDAAPGPAAGGPTRCWLIRGDRAIGLPEGDTIVGRDPECGVWLNAPSVSRRHARIRVTNGKRQITIEDLDSSNGTTVGGAPVQGRVPLSDGALVKFGSVETTLQLWNPETASATKRIPRKRR
jgi:DNA-binding winged helix-turn-helix (wHTH) protein